MCCRCCSVTQQKCWVFGLGIMFIIGAIINIVWVPKWVDNIVLNSLPLAPGSKTYDKWSVTPIPVYLHMYLFNWTNAREVQISGVKPHFQQVGPYVYREVKTKEDIVWHANKTVSFYGKRVWYYEPELTVGKQDDLITAPHLPSIAASHAIRDRNILVKIAFNLALNNNGGALYQTHTAGEWLFDGFYDEFLDFAMKQNTSETEKITSNEFAWFLDRNGTKEFEGLFTIHTGQDDLTQMGEIKFWNGMNHTGFYEGECGRLNGSTADLFVPNIPADKYITIYITDTCRILNLVPTGEMVTINGIEGMKYETKADTYDNGQLNPNMECYCPADKAPDNCPKTGVTDLGPCADGAPMFLSHPNFMHADPSYNDTVSGLFSDFERDNFFIIMERKLGVPLQVNAAVQVSLLVQKDTDITILKNVPEFYAPLFVSSSKAIISEDLAKELRLALNLPSITRYVGYGILGIGVVLIIIGIYLSCANKWYRHEPKIDKDI
ncbi:protein croquemort [Teleopsis dalmanni]|uniref:protein croquemort n=1 Tax=Teleopsis dalmanni TaxID=139649 RepID=UPI0018CF8964|nr:protein croquemort [Teleopsis dalmanni]